MADFARKERDRRRRKMLVDQGKTQEKIESKKNEEALVEKLQKTSREEREEAYVDWRKKRCKEIVTNNRVYKVNDFHSKKENELERVRQKEQENMQVLFEARNKQTQEMKRINKEVRTDEKTQKKQKHREICSEIIDLMLDVSDEAFDYVAVKEGEGDDSGIEKPKWREWMSLFIAGSQIAPTPSYQYMPTSPMIELEVPDIVEKATENLDFEEMLEYIFGLGQWKPEVISKLA